MNGNIYLIFNGGSGNRGCEAIVRGTNLLINSYGKVISFSGHIDEDYQVGLQDEVGLLELEKKHNPVVNKLRYIICALSYKFGSGYLQVRTIYENIWKNVSSNDPYLVIGGDVYCYGIPYIYYHINRILKRNKHILWACSIEPKSIDAGMKKDLLGYELIYTRESLTYEALLENGINRNTILCPDPAFLMDTLYSPLPNGFIENRTIGINVSPMIIDRAAQPETVLQNYSKLIEWIITNTDCQIALIPHVIWNNNDDRIPLNVLYQKYKDTKRVVIVPAESAQYMKGYISRCRFLVAARTHASIAAYSSCVPTLVVGYSVKAKGIAKDLFGQYDGYVVSVQELKNDDDLLKCFIPLWNRQDQIREHLRKFMPEYCDEFKKLKNEIDKILG